MPTPGLGPDIDVPAVDRDAPPVRVTFDGGPAPAEYPRPDGDGGLDAGVPSHPRLCDPAPGRRVIESFHPLFYFSFDDDGALAATRAFNAGSAAMHGEYVGPVELSRPREGVAGGSVYFPAEGSSAAPRVRVRSAVVPPTEMSFVAWVLATPGREHTLMSYAVARAPASSESEHDGGLDGALPLASSAMSPDAGGANDDMPWGFRSVVPSFAPSSIVPPFFSWLPWPAAAPSETNDLVVGLRRGDPRRAGDPDKLAFFHNGYRYTSDLPAVDPIRDGRWHFLAITWKDGLTRFYLDDQELPGPQRIQPKVLELRSGGVLVLGQDQAEPDEGYDAHQALNGGLDETALLDRALEAAQVEEIFQATRCVAP